MPLPASRSVVIISGLATLLVLAGGTLGLGFHNGWLRIAATDVPSRETLTASAQPTPIRNDRDAAALQSPQPQLASARHDADRLTEHDGDDDRRGRPSDRRRSHED